MGRHKVNFRVIEKGGRSAEGSYFAGIPDGCSPKQFEHELLREIAELVYNTRDSCHIERRKNELWRMAVDYDQ